jgi:hypothetical protein
LLAIQQKGTQMSTFDFSATLRQYAVNSARRIQLLREHAEDIGGSPDIVPGFWRERQHPALWIAHLERNYFNLADWYGWEELPGYDHHATLRALHGE